jgi:hypothetical protein
LGTTRAGIDELAAGVDEMMGESHFFQLPFSISH